MKSWMEKLDAHGLWKGPKKFLLRKLIRADQVRNSRTFTGTFEVDAFAGVPGLEGRTVLNLGFPGSLWHLREGIDHVRDEAGNLKVYQVAVQELNYEKQLIEPIVFRGHVQINGLSSVGLEIACQLAKLGVKVLSLYDPNINSNSEICSSRYRVTDTNQRKALSALEILGEGALCDTAECYYKYIDNEFGDVIINASSDIEVRRNLWAKIKGNDKIGLYIDAQVVGEKGKVFAFRPSDKEGIEIYEMDLRTSHRSNKEIVYMTGLVGSFAVMIFSKYMTTSGNARHVVFKRMFCFDADVLAVEL